MDEQRIAWPDAHTDVVSHELRSAEYCAEIGCTYWNGSWASDTQSMMSGHGELNSVGSD